MTHMWRFIKPSTKNLRIWQVGLLLLIFVIWHVATKPGLVPPIVFENDQQAAFFFGEPLKIFSRIWAWFVTNADIYQHLWVTLLETVLAFGIGTVLGLACGLWLALSPLAAAIADPYIKAANSMPRVILAPIFAVWFGLGIASKVALGVTLVFFIVFFNVYQGVKEVSPVVLLQAEGAFDINTVMAGILVLTVFALMLDAAVGKIELRLMKWQPRTAESERL